MSKNSTAIYVYLFAGILFLLSIAFENEDIALVFKPMIIPAMFFHYYKSVKGNMNSLFVASLFLFFIGDMLYLISLDDFFELGLLIFVLPYLIVLIFNIKDLRIILNKKNNERIDYTFVLIFVLLLGVLYEVINNIDIQSKTELIFYLFFGIELVLMGVLATMCYYNSNNKVNIFMLISVGLFILSDLFFIMNKNIYSLMIFQFLNGLSQTLSYYFYVRYGIERSRLESRVIK